MKSCRNCANAQHDGYFYVRLICGLNREVVVPFSSNLEENKDSDTRALFKANHCHAYTQEKAND
jgi:hypothetical protein